jgi:DNA-binding response OmpR family regulator
MSHEFRTPLNSIRALTRLLLAHSDGPLTAEQEVQLNFVAKATADLTQLVDDLLDLAKIEAGKIDVRPVEFTVEELFSALRGMLRPLLVSDTVALRFESASELPDMHTDEGKVSQILRNLISNALKFTERGEIRVSAVLAEDGAAVTFAVADTGIGIPKEDQERIFEEFTQVRSSLQARVKGTGLGLPLCRKLATLLGGSIALESAPGLGSTFLVTLPLRQAEAAAAPAVAEAKTVDAARMPVLVVEDQPDQQHLYERLLRGTDYEPVPAHTLRQAREALQQNRPAAILLDVILGNESAWHWLGELKSSAETAAVPVIVVSSVDDPRKGYALGADAYVQKPVNGPALLEELNRLTRARILIIDDDPAARYAIRKYCERQPYRVLEAADAREGLHIANTMRPELIVLDLNLPDRRGEEVLRELAGAESTSSIPVVIATSEALSAADRDGLQRAKAVFSKADLDLEAFERLLESLRSRGTAFP